MNKQVLCIVMAAALLLAAVVPMTTPVMAAEFSASKQTQPLLPNIYYVDDVIEYVMTIANPEENTETNTWTRIWDTLPDGTVVDFLLPGQTLVQPPGTSNTFNYAYTVDEGDLVWLSGPGYWVVRNRFEAEGFDSLDDSIATLVTRNSRVIRPDTRVSIDVDTGVYPDRTVVAGQEFSLIISEENTGYDELTDVFVRLRKRVPPATGTPETVIPTLDHTHASWTCSGNQDDVLDPGEIWTWTVPVTISEDTRFIALGFGTDPLGNEVSFATGYEDERDTVTITAVNPDIQIKKYTNGNDAYDPGDADVPEITVGDTVTWTYTITNTGDVDLTGIVVTDDQGVVPVYVSGDDGDGVLNPTETWTYEATGVAEAGLYANIGSVVSYYGAVQVLDSDPSHYRGIARLISLEKEVWDGESWHDADLPTGPYLPSTVNPVVFRFVITNAGTVDLTNVTLDDSHVDDFYTDQGLTTPAVFPIASLAPTASVTVYGSLAWTAGQHSNNATATGTPAGEPTPISAGDDCHYFGSEASIDIKKVVWDGAAWHDADTATGPYLPDTVDPVVFRFIITNGGNVPLTDVTLSDTDISGLYTDQGLTTLAVFPIATLAANVSATFYGSLGWGIGQHSNTATATGTPPDEPSISASNDCHYFGVGAYIDLQKAVWDGTTWHDADTPTGPYLSDSVDPVVFRFVITNAGSVNLSSVMLDDPDIDEFYTDQGLTIPAVFPIASLAPTASVTVYGSLAWTAGQHSNTATATGTPPDDPAISASDDCHYFGRTVPEITVGWDGHSVNKVPVLAPWIALMMGTIACAVLFVRRRQAQG